MFELVFVLLLHTVWLSVCILYVYIISHSGKTTGNEIAIIITYLELYFVRTSPFVIAILQLPPHCMIKKPTSSTNSNPDAYMIYIKLKRWLQFQLIAVTGW